MDVIAQESKDELNSVLQYFYGVLEILAPEDVMPQRKAITYLGSAGTHYSIGVLLSLLGQGDLAKNHFSQAIPFVRQGLSFNPAEEEIFQYALLAYSFLTGNAEQLDESAKVVSVLETRLLAKSYRRNKFNPHFDIAISHLWLAQTDKAKIHIDKLENIENKKSEENHFFGTASSLKAIVERDEEKLIHSLEQILYEHVRATKRLRYPLGDMHYICESAVCITILALRYGMDVKSKLLNGKQVISTKPFSTADNPDLPKNKKFKVPVDLIPNYMLSPWVEHFKHKL